MKSLFVLTVLFALSLSGPAHGQGISGLFEKARGALEDSGLFEAPPERPETPPAPAAPPVPQPRPDERIAVADADGATPEEPAPVGEEDLPLPLPRPEAEDRTEEVVPIQQPEEGASGEETASEPAQPSRVYQAACPAVLNGLIEARPLPPIDEGTCGLQSPLEVTALTVAGRRVALSQPAILNCRMATELAHWAARIDSYVEASLNAGLEEVLSGTSYFCRPRNNVDGADISEHGFGNGLDVIGFALESGERISLPKDWGDGTPQARAMEYAHDTACGHFTTVLGPEANALHEDHLHLDLGCHGRTCTARLCE